MPIFKKFGQRVKKIFNKQFLNLQVEITSKILEKKLTEVYSQFHFRAELLPRAHHPTPPRTFLPDGDCPKKRPKVLKNGTFCFYAKMTSQ